MQLLPFGKKATNSESENGLRAALLCSLMVFPFSANGDAFLPVILDISYILSANPVGSVLKICLEFNHHSQIPPLLPRARQP